jgi:CHAD domain-containing protein
MSRGSPLVRSFNDLGKEFSAACKKVRVKPSEKPIHRLRVSARRLIATIDIVPDISEQKAVAAVRRKLKKVLKWTSQLRDIQVQVDRAAHTPKADIRRFMRALKTREKQEIVSLQNRLKRLGTTHLENSIGDVRGELMRVQKKLDGAALTRAIEWNLQLCRRNFEKSRKKFRSNDEDTLHDMRIALKKLRYASEAARPVLGNSIVKHAPAMKKFQQLVGDARDAGIFAAELEKWALRKGKQKAIAVSLQGIQSEHERRLASIVKLLPSLGKLNVLPTRPRPQRRRAVSPDQKRKQDISEKTMAVSAGPAPINELAGK